MTNVEARGLWELPIDLDWVATVLEGDPMRSQGAFLDLTTGEVIHSSMIDFVAADREGSATMLAEPDRWLFLPSLGSRAVRQDMADFAAMITYLPLRKRVTEAIEGLGAFHRFRDLIHSEGLVEEWHAFSDYRRIARAPGIPRRPRRASRCVLSPRTGFMTAFQDQLVGEWGRS